MSNSQNSPIPPGSEKHHYHILDGLRGVAAIVVVWFHIFEAYATSHVDQIINHGYLAVDFFFMLSGFVIGLHGIMSESVWYDPTGCWRDPHQRPAGYTA